jgi:hypothetical protein
MKVRERMAMGTAALYAPAILRFLGGVLTIIVASVIGGIVGGYLFSLIWAGPHTFWQPIDRTVTLDCAIDGIIAGNILGIVSLAWLSNRRQDWTFFRGGLAAIAVEVALFLLLVGPRALM